MPERVEVKKNEVVSTSCLWLLLKLSELNTWTLYSILNTSTCTHKVQDQLKSDVCLSDELGGERDKFRLVLGELDSTFTELTGF